MAKAPEPEPPSVPSRIETGIKAVLNLIPWVGGSIATIYEDYVARRSYRMTQTVQAALEQLGPDREDVLIARLKSDEVFSDQFFVAVIQASESSVEAKRIAIGRALGEMASEDEYELDDADLMVKALLDLDLAHLRLLMRLDRFKDDPNLMASMLAATPEPVLAGLLRHGLVLEVDGYNGRHVEGLTPFGQRLLGHVLEAAPLPPE